MITLKQTWLDGNIHHFDRYLPAFSMGIFYGELLVERRDFPISFGEHDKVPTISLAEQQLRVIKEQSTVRS